MGRQDLEKKIHGGTPERKLDRGGASGTGTEENICFPRLELRFHSNGVRWGILLSSQQGEQWT